MTEAASYVDVLWVCKYCSTKHMLEDVYTRFRQALFDRIKDMTDVELRVCGCRRAPVWCAAALCPAARRTWTETCSPP